MNSIPQFSLPSDGFIKIVPEGNFKDPANNTTLVIDGTAIESILSNIQLALGDNEAVYLDYDGHSFDLNTETRSAAWVKTVVRRSDGIWADFNWTNDGKEHVESGDYKFLVASFIPSDCQPSGIQNSLRPLRLSQISLANAPHRFGFILIRIGDGRVLGSSSESGQVDLKNQVSGLMIKNRWSYDQAWNHVRSMNPHTPLIYNP